MSIKLKFMAALAACTSFVTAAVAVLGAVIWSGLPPENQALILASLPDRIGAVLFLSLLLIVVLGMLLHAVFEHYVLVPRRLAAETLLILNANPAHRIECESPAELAQLAAVINVLATRCEGLQKDVDLKVVQTKSDFEEERNRLAALMSELSESVIVCNSEGRILLYNEHARQLFSSAGEKDGGSMASDFIGLGRSLFAVIDRDVISHALEHIHHRMRQGDRRPIASFTTATRGGQLLGARIAPVPGGTPPQDGRMNPSGFVLVLDDVAREVELGGQRDQLLRSLTEGTRSSLANIRAALDNLVDYPQMAASQHEQFLHIIDDETTRLAARLDQLSISTAGQPGGKWPLATMLGRDVLSALQRSIESCTDLTVTQEAGEDSIWLSADGFLLVEALTHLAGRLRLERGVRQIALRLQPRGSRICLDLCWRDGPLDVETALRWENEGIAVAGQPRMLSFMDIVARHGGEAWYKNEVDSGLCYFRLLLPAAEQRSEAGIATRVGSRPTYYDFDLFHQPGQIPALDERPLAELHYTVFDTETTGLNPSNGDEIVAIGAVRIVNARLLTAEVFEKLVNPRRGMSSVATRIHGITDVMLRDQPPIEQVLPGFHSFCADTVLVAHNAAFDMRFLQIKERAAGVIFGHPVLDTLMLSAVLHPDHTDHTLEAIAARFGVGVIGRHTALGDALVTGQIFLKMIPLLQQMGIVTLKQAREAEQETPFARIGF